MEEENRTYHATRYCANCEKDWSVQVPFGVVDVIDENKPCPICGVSAAQYDAQNKDSYVVRRAANARQELRESLIRAALMGCLSSAYYDSLSLDAVLEDVFAYADGVLEILDKAANEKEWDAARERKKK